MERSEYSRARPKLTDILFNFSRFCGSILISVTVENKTLNIVNQLNTGKCNNCKPIPYAISQKFRCTGVSYLIRVLLSTVCVLHLLGRYMLTSYNSQHSFTHLQSEKSANGILMSYHSYCNYQFLMC